MADDAIDYMTRMHQIQPDKPILIKYAPGATHDVQAPQGTRQHDDRGAVSSISSLRAGVGRCPRSGRRGHGS